MNTACQAGTEFRIEAKDQSSEMQRIGYEHRLQPGTEFIIEAQDQSSEGRESGMNTACSQAGTEFRIPTGSEFRRQRIGYEHRLHGRNRVQNRGTGSEFRKAENRV